MANDKYDLDTRILDYLERCLEIHLKNQNSMFDSAEMDLFCQMVMARNIVWRSPPSDPEKENE